MEVEGLSLETNYDYSAGRLARAVHPELSGV